MKLTYIILPDEQFIIERMEGEVYLENLTEITRKLWEDPEYHPDLKALLDIRDASIHLAPSDLGQLTEFLMNSGQSAIADLALVVTAPMETAISHLFEKQMMHRRQVAVFSDIPAAYEFLAKPAFLHNLLQEDQVKIVTG